MLTTPMLAQFLVAHEGLRLRAYDDFRPFEALGPDDVPEGTATIGYGTTRYPDGSHVRLGDTITEPEARDFLTAYIREDVEPVVENLIHIPLEPHQYDAIGSLIYNFGASEVSGWRLIRRINSQEPDESIALEWMDGTYTSKGRPMLGLYRRRMAEVLMWFGLEWKAGFNVGWDDKVLDVLATMGWQAKAPAPVTYKGFADPTPEDGRITTQDLNTIQLAIMQGATPGEKPLSVNTKLPEQVPYGINDPREVGLKPMEESSRYKGAVKAEKGRDNMQVAGGLAVAAGAAGSAKEITSFFDAYDFSTILVAMLVVAGVFGAIGLYRWWDGQNKRYKAEQDAQQGLY